jgi:aryl-alcohol dehydrogenase-like predicted oxidoreductase
MSNLRPILGWLNTYVLIDTPLEESIPALDEIRRAGKTKYIGLSECSAATLRKANSSNFLPNPSEQDHSADNR